MKLYIVRADMHMGFNCFLHKEENGKDFIAEISEEMIPWKEVKEGHIHPITLRVKSVEAHGIDSKNWEERYKAMDEAREEHIQNLNQILDKVLNKINQEQLNAECKDKG